MTILTLTILTIYELVGIKHGLLQSRFERWLQPSASVHLVETPQQLPPTPYAKSTEQFSSDAAAYYALDVASGLPLLGANQTKQLPIASLTKITTALVLLQNHQDGEVITVPETGPYGPDDALLHIKAGEQFEFQNLLAAALIPSDNDAAEALAIADSKTIPAFSAKMNRLTQEWGVEGTRYVSASGLTDEGNYATAESLAKLAKLGLANSLFARLTATPSIQITNTGGQAYQLKTTNQLLGSRTSGIKTGFTAAAGQCFVGLATIQGHKVITVVLGSTDRFGETARLIDYIDRNYSWQ